MFLNQKILNKLMKAACKGGLTVARKEDWIYLAGRGWKAKIKESYMPNKTKGDLITLIGELPKNGECYVAGTKEITKDEKFSWPSYEGGDREELYVTQIILKELNGMLRVLQYEDGRITTKLTCGYC